MSRTSIAHHTFTGLRVTHGVRVRACRGPWRSPLAWNRAAETAGERRRVLVGWDPFAPWDGPVVDRNGDALCRCEACHLIGYVTHDRGERSCGACGRDADGLHPLTAADICHDLFALIDRTPHLDWLLRTEYPEHVKGMWPAVDDGAGGKLAEAIFGGPGKLVRKKNNVTLAALIHDQATADARVPPLLKCGDLARLAVWARLRGPVDLSPWLLSREQGQALFDALGEISGYVIGEPVAHVEYESPIDWLIAEGDTDPVHPSWVRALRDQAQAAQVPFAFLGWGDWLPYEQDAQPPFWISPRGDLVDGHVFPEGLVDHREVNGWWLPELDSVVYRRVGRKASGCLLDGKVWHEVPEVQR